MKKFKLAIAVAMAAFALSGCSTASTASTPTLTASANKDIVGFGATLSSWNSHHVADKSGDFIPGCCYNADSNLKSWGGNFRYTDVVLDNGVVTGYSLNLPARTKLDDAKAAALAELPKDAKISFFFSHSGSATLEATSELLKPILADPQIGDAKGSVDFVFCSVASDGSFGYNPDNVNSIWVKLGTGLEAAKDATC